MFLDPFAEFGEGGHELRRISIVLSAAFDFVFARFANGLFSQIPFVDDDDAGLALFDNFVGDFLVLFGNAGFGVEDENGNVATRDGILGAFDAEEFDGIVYATSFSHASSIDEKIGLANAVSFDFERHVNRVASCAGDWANDDAG